MKFRLFNLLILLATSGLLPPTQAAFGLVPTRQVNQEKVRWMCVEQAQQLSCNVDTDGEKALAIAHQGSTINRATTQSAADLKSSTVTIVPPLVSPLEQKLVANILIGLSYLLPSGLVLWILLSESYGAYRSAILRKQIDSLEKLWQSGSDNDATTDSERGAQS